MCRSHRTIHQKRFRSAANAGAPHLGVERNSARHIETGCFIDIEMADAFQMREDRHPRFRLDPRNKTFAATRHDYVNRAIEALQHFADSGAVGHRHDLDRIGRQVGGFKPLTSAL